MSNFGVSDLVVPHDIDLVPAAEVCRPVLLKDDFTAFVTFHAVRLTRDKRRKEAGTAVIEIVRCTASKFGRPNAATLGSHPLARAGLRPYGIFEVLTSSWVHEKTAQTREAFPDTPDSRQRHFIFTFHESTLECIADSLIVSLSQEPYAEILRQISTKVLREQSLSAIPWPMPGVARPEAATVAPFPFRLVTECG